MRGQRTAHEERSGTPNRLARVSTRDSAPSSTTGRDGRAARSAYAEIAHADASADPACHQHIPGTTGLAILDAILAGERNPAELAKLRDPRIKASPETVQKSLLGNWREEHLFRLGQSLEL